MDDRFGVAGALCPTKKRAGLLPALRVSAAAGMLPPDTPLSAAKPAAGAGFVCAGGGGISPDCAADGDRTARIAI